MVELGHLITLFICAIVFFLFFLLQLFRVYKKRPDLLLPSRIQKNYTESNYTFDVNLVRGFALTAFGFAEGAYLICNRKSIFKIYDGKRNYSRIGTKIG